MINGEPERMQGRGQDEGDDDDGRPGADMIARIHEGGDTKTSDQLRTTITEIQEGGGGGRGDMYKGEGTGRQDKDEAEGIRGRGRGASGQTLLPAS